VVFAFFGSTEELQVVAIKAAHEIFVEQVVTPTLAVEPVSIGCGGCASAGWRTRSTGNFPAGFARLSRGWPGKQNSWATSTRESRWPSCPFEVHALGRAVNADSLLHGGNEPYRMARECMLNRLRGGQRCG
jgi:hypothetical protein